MKEWNEPRLYTLGVESTSSDKIKGAGDDKYLSDGLEAILDYFYPTTTSKS